MSRRARTRKNLNEDDEEPEITSGDEAEREYEKHADEPTDSDEVIDEKVDQLVELMKTCHTKLIYTGAGISTAANIPDYRGPGGVYTMAKKGVAVTCHDIVSQSPTTSHLVIKELYRHSYIAHIVSQNCDGMHIRSGIPQNALSEIHGNMHIEVCSMCPDRQYLRTFDVTEDSGFRAHGTSRACQCGYPLLDTIVHYGERGRARFPLNWEAAQEIVPVADLIICIGSSLQVLKDYKFLWPAPGSTAKIVIINLQWTPKDKDAALIIRGDCEQILMKVAQKLDIDIKHYCRDCDPILATRRNTRNGELLMKLTDCTCHIRPPRLIVGLPSEEQRRYSPGWWRVGVKCMTKEFARKRRSNTKEDSGYDENNKDPSSTPSPKGLVPVKRGRPRKRKSSKDERAESVAKGRRRTSGSDDDEYAPQRHQQRMHPSTIRSTRSSGAAEEQPLVGDFRKKRHDAGRRKKGQLEQEEQEEESPVLPPVETQPVPRERPEEEEEVDVEGGGENEAVNVEEEEEYVVVDVIEGEAAAMNGMLALHDHIVLNDVSLSSLSMDETAEQPMIFQPAEGQPGEEDSFVDVEGDDFEELEVEEVEEIIEEEIIGDYVEPEMMNGESGEADLMYNEQPNEMLSGSGASLVMSLSQLNDPNQQREPTIHLVSSTLDVYEFHEEPHHAHHEMMAPPMGFSATQPSSFCPYRSSDGNYKKNLSRRYENECNGNIGGTSSSTYYEPASASAPLPFIPPPTEFFEEAVPPPVLPAPSAEATQQLSLSQPDQSETASVSAPPPPARPTLRVGRSRGNPKVGSVEFFLRQINGGRGPSERTTSLGAVLEHARQLIDPEEDEELFRECLISTARAFKGEDADPAPEPVRKKSKKAARKSKRERIKEQMKEEQMRKQNEQMRYQEQHLMQLHQLRLQEQRLQQ